MTLNSSSKLVRAAFAAVALALALAGTGVRAAELDGPTTVQLGEPIIFQVTDAKPEDNVIWHVFPSTHVSERQFGLQLALWSTKATVVEVLAVYIPKDGPPEKLVETLTIGTPDPDDPTPTPGPQPIADKFGLVRVAREAKATIPEESRVTLSRLLASTFKTVSARLSAEKPDGTLAAQVQKLQEDTIAANRAVIKTEERDQVTECLARIMAAINAADLKTFSDYLTAWEEISRGLD